MGKFFYDRDEVYEDKSFEKSVSKKDINSNYTTEGVCSKTNNMLESKEKYINSKLVELGFYKGEKKVVLKDSFSRDLIKINGEFFEKKKELSKEDELFLKLKIIDILQENQKILEEQKKILKGQEYDIGIIKSILIFFTIITIFSVMYIVLFGIIT